MIDISDTIKPKSDQLNADDLIAESMTIKVTKVNKQVGDQPVAINFEGDNGKPFLPCKSMRRVLVQVWGKDAAQYIGRKMTIFRDAKVTWAGAEVGGIRISHMSDIKNKVVLSLTAAKSKRAPYTILPLGEDTPVVEVDVEALKVSGNTATQLGSDELKKWFTSLSNNEKLAIKPFMDDLKTTAKSNDNEEGVM